MTHLVVAWIKRCFLALVVCTQTDAYTSRFRGEASGQWHRGNMRPLSGRMRIVNSRSEIKSLRFSPDSAFVTGTTCASSPGGYQTLN